MCNENRFMRCIDKPDKLSKNKMTHSYTIFYYDSVQQNGYDQFHLLKQNPATFSP